MSTLSDKAKALCAAATEGAWEDDNNTRTLVVGGNKQTTVCDVYQGDADKNFIKQSRTLLAELAEQIERLEADELMFRQMLWVKHSHPDKYTYGDDGEMQCSCGLDFKRASATEIYNKLHFIAIEAYKKTLKDIES